MKKILIKTATYYTAIRSKKQAVQQKVKADLVKVKAAFAQESVETKEMLHIYRRFTQKQASKAEMKIANKQFGDLLKSLGLGVFAVLPFAPITIPIIVKLGKRFGIDVLPSSFNDWGKSTENHNTTSVLNNDIKKSSE